MINTKYVYFFKFIYFFVTTLILIDNVGTGKRLLIHSFKYSGDPSRGAARSELLPESLTEALR